MAMYIYIQLILPVIHSFSNGTIRGHNNRFLQPTTRTDIYKYFFPTAVKLCNSLPTEVINARTINEFKNLLANL